jgi:hypothetical protein
MPSGRFGTRSFVDDDDGADVVPAHERAGVDDARVGLHGHDFTRTEMGDFVGHVRSFLLAFYEPAAKSY